MTFVRIASAALLAAALSAAPSFAGDVGTTVRIDAGSRSFTFAADPQRSATARLAFKDGSAALTPELKQAVKDLRARFARPELRDQPFAVIVDGADRALAYQRAKAIRTALLERRGDDAEKVVAAAGADDTAPGAAVRFAPLDAKTCKGCGATSIRTLALDSTLSTVTTARLDGKAPEAVAAAAPAQAPDPKPTTPVVTTVVAGAKPAPEPASAPRSEATLQRVASTGACGRPAVVLDDYYPGGPIVPCRKAGVAR